VNMSEIHEENSFATTDIDELRSPPEGDFYLKLMWVSSCFCT